MREAVRLVGVALALLTRLPVRARHEGAGDLGRAAAAFPLVGLLVAGVGIAVRAGTGLVWGSLVGTIAAVAVMVVVTGALHEDGLADAVDGLWGGRDAEGRLAIMRDSRVGTYGIVALVTFLALRVAFLAPLDVVGFAKAVAAAQALAQAGMVLVARLSEPVGGGFGAAFGRPPRRALLLAWLLAGGVAVASAGWLAPVLVVLAALAALGCSGLADRRLGGFTGDVLGAANTVVHLVVLATAAVLV